MSRLKINFDVRIGTGGIITFQGDRANQAVFWELKAVDRDTLVEWPGAGTLAYPYTHTNESRLTTNTYLAPTHQPCIRCGQGHLVGEGHLLNDPWYVDDKVIVRWLS